MDSPSLTLPQTCAGVFGESLGGGVRDDAGVDVLSWAGVVGMLFTGRSRDYGDAGSACPQCRLHASSSRSIVNKTGVNLPG